MAGKTLGLLPPLGGGLTDLKETGQADRLIDHYFKTYVRHFDRIYFFSYFNERLEDFTDDKEVLDRVSLVAKKSRLPKFLYGLLLSFRQARYFRQCDVFRVYQAPGALPLIPRVFSRRPSLVTYGYNYVEYARINQAGAIKMLMLRLVQRLSLRRATVVLITNDQMLPLLGRKNLGKVVKIPNGVDTGQFSSETRTDREPEPVRLIYVGRFSPEKNLPCLFEALAMVSTRRRLKLILAGNGESAEDLRHLAGKLNIDVEFKGTVPYRELPSLLNSADIFVLPSLVEGHPKALIEAMSCGLPSIASRSEGNTAVIADGVTGLLFDPHDPAELARKIAWLIEQPESAREIGGRARALIQEKYDLRRLIDEEVSVLKGLAAG